MKAAFLPKLANFVTWPESAFADTTSPVVVGILGDEVFGKQLEDDFKSLTVHGRPVVVQRFSKTPTNGLHLLFVGASRAARVKEIRRTLRAQPVLIVGDTDGFAEAGGMINFTTRTGKVRFEINLQAARSCGLQISSRLLQVSTVVIEEGAAP